jgi:hypothetical protein
MHTPSGRALERPEALQGDPTGRLASARQTHAPILGKLIGPGALDVEIRDGAGEWPVLPIDRSLALKIATGGFGSARAERRPLPLSAASARFAMDSGRLLSRSTSGIPTAVIQPLSG